MDKAHLHELRRRDADYWWHVNKRRIVLDLLGRHAAVPGRLLEIGCGAGTLSAQLAGAGWHVVASDLEPEAVAFAREGGAAEGKVFDAGQPWPEADGACDAVMALDVLEHIADDALAATELCRVLRPQGLALITVPACPVLYSRWDEMLGHRRRYTQGALRRVLESAALEIVRLTHWNLVSLPIAFLLRGKDRLFGSREEQAEFPDVPHAVNGLLKAWGRIEAAYLARCTLPLGLSLVAVVRKPGAESTPPSGSSS